MSGFIGASNSRDGVIDRSQPLGKVDSPTFVAPTFTGAAVLGTPASGTITNLTGTLTNPTFVNPALGTPASGVVTNLSGVLPSAVTGGSGLTALGTVTAGTLNGANLTSLKSSDGSVTAMICDSTGRIFTPARPAFAVKSASIQTDISSGGGGSFVVFGAVGTDVFDIGNNFDSSTFTAPVAGIYFFSTSVQLNQIPIDCVYVDLRMQFTGGPPLLQNFMSEPPQTGVSDNISFSQIVNMDVDDTAQVKVYYDGGSGLDIAAGDGTRFCGYLVG